MGGHHRWDDADDAYMCADEVTRLCPEIPKGNNFALLVCLQEKAKVQFIIVRLVLLNDELFSHDTEYIE